MAHVAVTTTLPVLGCLWLEKVTHNENGGRLGEGMALIPDSHNVHTEATQLRRSPSTTSVTLQTPVLACSLGYFSDPFPLKDNF